MSLQLRGPQSLAEIKTVVDRIIRANIEHLQADNYRAAKREGDPDSVYEYVLQHEPDLIANAHKAFLPGLIDHEIVGEVIMNMRWAVMDLTAGPDTLLTADRPFTTSHGLADPACVLVVPLSPTHLFAATNDIRRLRNLAAQPAEDTVRRANDLMVKLAVQNVYGSTATHLDFVEERLRRSNDPPVAGVILRE